MKKVNNLITGVAGFIGFHTAKQLLDSNEQVVGIDNFNDYYDPSLKEARVAELLKHENFTLVRGDLSERQTVIDLFSNYQFDKVCHLAAQAGVRYSLENPNAYVQSNLVAFMNVLEAVRNYEVKNFVYASSSSVYGKNTKVPFSITDRVDEPVSLYATTKRSNELMAYTYHHLYGIPSTGLRFFTVVGPYGRPDMAMMLFTDAIINDRPIKVFNQGNMERDFTYIDDIVDGVIRSMDTPSGYRIFNLGNNQPVKLEYLISCLERSLDKKAKREYLPMQAGDVPRTFADISHTTEKLGWKPTTDIDDAVKHFVNWYKSFYHYQ